MHKYELYYNPSTPIWHFTNGMTHIEKVEFCNTVALPELRANNYKPVYVDLLANMVRLNWMCFNVKWQPLVKPVVATALPNGDWQTVVGDTRLAAYELNGFTRIRAILQAETAPKEPGWLKIENKKCLAIAGGCREQDVMIDDWHSEPLHWVEFASSHTKDHMHNQPQRFDMMCNYLQSQPIKFVFTKFWFLEPVDWTKYDNLSSH